MFRGPDYKLAEKHAMKQNIAEARRAVLNKEEWAINKAHNIAQRYSFHPQNLLNRAARGERVALALLAKTPSRQSLHLKVFAEWLKRLKRRGLIKEIEELSSGPNAQVLSKGQIIPKAIVTTDDTSNKAIKFHLKVPCRDGYWNVFVAHSYIDGKGGGTQNLQFKEIKKFIIEAGKNSDKDVIFVVVCDGSYYTSQSGGKNRLDILMELNKSGMKVIPTSSKNLPEILHVLSICPHNSPITPFPPEGQQPN